MIQLFTFQAQYSLITNQFSFFSQTGAEERPYSIRGSGARYEEYPFMNEKKSGISRRTFLDATGKYTVGGWAALGMLGASRLNPQAGTQADAPGSLTSKLSKFIGDARYDLIPPKVLETAKTAIMDCLGVA